MRILIVKTSSLGDVIHTLPALTDAMRAIPDLQADWVVEEAFAEIPGWHPAVVDVIPVAIRRWRKNWWQSLTGGEYRRFRRQLKSQRYDVVIDAQGLVKSALIAWQARGQRVGLDRDSIKEPASSFLYQKRMAVPKGGHAVQRVRQLFAQAMGYSFDPEAIDYGIQPGSPLPASGDRPALMFLHGTTWQSKHWPLPYWQELARLAVASGYEVRVSWGNLQEQERAEAIADGLTGVTVLDKQSLTGLAQQLQQCQGVVAVDTGLGHLAAALNIPTVSMYGATNPGLSGTFGYHQLHLKADLACSPCMRRECSYRGQPLFDTTEREGEFQVQPPCYRSLAPDMVFSHLCRMITEADTQGEQP
ncbi:lipopolysaccharide heptosyltransferase I [Pseudohongiella sp. O18]|uniref:lipopolysaccharide heptosyltransferase I n=1 Tax=Pseudohongiella sp. O18 TaxID=2904248 RepID=UPI001F021B19|nr:lipopolysaccharide heptosyltransferase I [Pseudohongiella sp. O18]